MILSCTGKERKINMITSKQRADLRSLAHGIQPIFQIGKCGITEETVRQLSNAIEARELIKIHILESAGLDTRETCSELARALEAEPVQAIGSKVVLFKRAENEKNRKIELPGEKPIKRAAAVKKDSSVKKSGRPSAYAQKGTYRRADISSNSRFGGSRTARGGGKYKAKG